MKINSNSQQMHIPLCIFFWQCVNFTSPKICIVIHKFVFNMLFLLLELLPNICNKYIFKSQEHSFLRLGRMPAIKVNICKIHVELFLPLFPLLGKDTMYTCKLYISSNYFFFFGRMPIPLQRIPSITSSAPPAIEPSRPSLSQMVTSIS